MFWDIYAVGWPGSDAILEVQRGTWVDWNQQNDNAAGYKRKHCKLPTKTFNIDHHAAGDAAAA